MSQKAYWNGVGAGKTFTHPVQHQWLAGVDRGARVLDYGCGYGRVVAELGEHGFRDVSGVDISPALVARGRKDGLRLSVLESPPVLPHAAGSVDVVLLFAVLTCVPEDEAQRAMVAELVRVLAPGGLLYVSDLLLQDDRRNRDRYAAQAARGGLPYGAFVTGEGAVCRHHDLGHLRALLAEVEVVDERRIEVTTMNGHPARAVQVLARKS
ncbi:class I SAM-dependent methyltransferase [Nonomuraea sp. NPDC050310]|uniref:class I SAM-dependent methyltransferase n=1 Tax=Nonomuraea sp. NPDC050310 TaxID=3154935 RepID=UPI0033F43CFE